MIKPFLTLCAVFVLVAGCSKPAGGGGKVPAGAKSSGGKHAVIETDKGPIEIEFLDPGIEAFAFTFG